VGIEFEVEESRYILRAAAEQVVKLMTRLQGGQWRPCKFVRPRRGLGDIEGTRYSTFALPDYERGQGSTLLLPGPRLRGPGHRAAQLRRGDHPAGLPLRKGVAEVVSNEPVTTTCATWC
jgi:propane monooxygenase reductase subunit